MNNKIRTIIDELYIVSNEASIPLEEIQEEIARRFKLNKKWAEEEIQEDISRRIKPKRKASESEFEKKVREFVEMLTYEGNERSKNLCRQRTIEALCIFHNLKKKNTNLTSEMLIESCCKKWKCSIEVAQKQISGDKKRFCRWNNSNQDPLGVEWLIADGRNKSGRTKYVFDIVEKYISNIWV